MSKLTEEIVAIIAFVIIFCTIIITGAFVEINTKKQDKQDCGVQKTTTHI